MKFYSFFIALSILFVGCSTRNNTANNRNDIELSFVDSVHNFGIVSIESPIVSYDYKFVNNGTKPIVVLGVDVSCECTKADYDHVPVMPGDTSFIRVTYDGTGRGAEHFNKSVFVTTNAPGDPFELTFEGELQ